jgi:transcriptional regulator GlxA family with amidase domain
MSAKYTPGPWQWNGDYILSPVKPDPSKSATHTILSPDGPFGFLGADTHAVDAEFQANKTLIAAAPELLEALRRAERKLAAYVGVCTGDKELTGAVLPMARSAIAKAAGSAA